MKTIIINSQKGGSGKTTLCAHLAVQAERAGDGAVYLIDTDPQGTLSTWHEHREAEVPLDKLAEGLALLKESNAAYCFIDTAPTRTDENAALSHHGPVAETLIADRVPYVAAMTDGRTALELAPKGPAAIETAALWKNIKV